MSECKPISCPLDVSMKLSKDGNSTNNASYGEKFEGPYMEAIGSLIYLMVATRPDIAFAVGLVSRYSSDPRKQHWASVKHILRYLKSTQEKGLLYDGNSSDTLHGFSDADWGNDIDDKKSTSGYCFKLSSAAVFKETKNGSKI